MLYSKFIVHRKNQLNEMEVQSRVLYVFLCNFLNFNIRFPCRIYLFSFIFVLGVFVATLLALLIISLSLHIIVHHYTRFSFWFYLSNISFHRSHLKWTCGTRRMDVSFFSKIFAKIYLFDFSFHFTCCGFETSIWHWVFEYNIWFSPK